MGKGAQIDKGLPYDPIRCGSCMQKGFWTIFLTALGIPTIIILLVWIITALMRHWRQSLYIVRNRYQPVEV